MNENIEKRYSNNENIVGVFGVGLKDALAVFHNNKISVKILTRDGLRMTLVNRAKGGFEDHEVLHIKIDKESKKNLEQNLF